MRNLDLKARILAGEQIPREELVAFILTAEADLSAERKKRNSGETFKPQDVDFF